MTIKQTMWKKTAATTLALSMIVGGATSVMASADSWKNESSRDDDKHHKKENKGKVKFNLNFDDLNEQELKWAYEHIIRLASKGVFTGYDDGNFKPQNKITRVEAIIAAVRLLGLEEEAKKPENMNATLNFKDFDQLKKKYGAAVGYVTVALENDLFSETDTSIQADKPANRLWATVLLVKSLNLSAEAKKKMDTVLPFKDAHEIPAGSVGYIAVAIEKKLISGYTDGTFKPNRTVTRAELAALLDRLDEQLPEQENAQAITGTIQAVSASSLTVKKADNTTVTVPIGANVFIFRKDVKSPVSALEVGDTALVRTYEGKAVFIEVTKTAEVNIPLLDSGKVVAYSVNAQGKIATISVSKAVNGVQSTIIYNVASDVTVTGNSGILSTDLNVVVKGSNNVVNKIEVQA